jgi:hypothetical protein
MAVMPAPMRLLEFRRQGQRREGIYVNIKLPKRRFSILRIARRRFDILMKSTTAECDRSASGILDNSLDVQREYGTMKPMGCRSISRWTGRLGDWISTEFYR